MSGAQQFIVLPTRGMRAGAEHAALAGFLNSMHVATASRTAFNVRGAPGLTVRVLDSIHEDGAKLVEIAPEAMVALRTQQPGLRLVPVVYYRPAVVPRFAAASTPRTAARTTAATIKLRVVSKADGGPVAGAMVVAFTDFAHRVGAQGTTNSKGEVSLRLGAASKKLQRLYVYPERGFWSGLRKGLTVTSGTQIGLEPVQPSFTDCLRHFYGEAPDGTGSGVTVGVIDTGSGPHPDLQIEGGVNTVLGESPNDFGDNGEGHGTHVAGIIAARGLPPRGLRGLAPGVTLRSYRVFGKNKPSASNFAIAKAIDQAVTDQCDLINMSLGGGAPDEATRVAIEDARAQGTLAIVAAGNDDRSPVSFPASDALAIAVSALGRKGTFPKGTTESGDVAAPFGTDKNNFVAGFSNIGLEIDLIGSGVGILSTVPGGYGPMSGTSMACPAVTGFAARLLARRADIRNMPRGPARSDAVAQALFEAATPLGFAPKFEGHGLPR
jgi:subtilisin